MIRGGRLRASVVASVFAALLPLAAGIAYGKPNRNHQPGLRQELLAAVSQWLARPTVAPAGTTKPVSAPRLRTPPALYLPSSGCGADPNGNPLCQQ
jgi:hypothetical protein